MGKYMREDLKKDLGMEKEHVNLKMVVNIQENLKKENMKEEANLYGIMELNMSEISKIIKWKEKAK